MTGQPMRALRAPFAYREPRHARFREAARPCHGGLVSVGVGLDAVGHAAIDHPIADKAPR